MERYPKEKPLKAGSYRSGKLKAFFLVSLLLFVLSCEKTYEVKLPPQEFFLNKYREGIYRFKVIKNKPLYKIIYKTRCEVELKDLLKGERYRMRLQEETSCRLFSNSRYLEIAGDKFTPPKGFKIVQNIPLEGGLYIWVYEGLERRSRKSGKCRIFRILCREGADYDYGRYRTRPSYGGK